jgi:hypothetical protein
LLSAKGGIEGVYGMGLLGMSERTCHGKQRW